MIKNNSCSSKVLIAGGYSILFEGNKGLVLSTSACYNSQSELTAKDQPNEQSLERTGVIEIESKGFNKTWKYFISLQNEKNQLVITEPNEQSKNVFLEASLRTGLGFVYNELKEPFNLRIEVNNDKAFYSIDQHEGKTVFKKSGLGSSACLITTVLASVLDQFNAITHEKKDLGLLHILCQVANSIAQNKIGSGFDISSAIFGNQVYSRFPVKEVEILVDALVNEKDVREFGPLVLKTLQESQFQWIIPSQLIFPESLKLWLVDLETGSDTRSFVKDILKYLETDPLWKGHFFETSNFVAQEVFNSFQEISAIEKSQEKSEEKLELIYENLRRLSGEYRDLLKELGTKAQVEVEPDLLTFVLDELVNENMEIVYAVCPGAGGYDAACLISTKKLGEEKLNKRLEEISLKVREKGEFEKFKDIKLNILPVTSYPDSNIKFF